MQAAPRQARAQKSQPTPLGLKPAQKQAQGLKQVPVLVLVLVRGQRPEQGQQQLPPGG